MLPNLTHFLPINHYNQVKYKITTTNPSNLQKDASLRAPLTRSLWPPVTPRPKGGLYAQPAPPTG